MIFFKDNPNLKFSKVKTVNGITEYRRNCRKIKDKYYIMGIDCVEIEKKWYVITSKLITFDYENNTYVLVKNTPLVYGVVGFKNSGTPIFGYFTENKYNNVMVNVSNYGPVKALNSDILANSDYAENISDGTWVCTKGLSPTAIARLKRIESRKVYREKGYNIEDNAIEFKQKIDAYEKYPTKISSNAVRYGKMLGNTTFGAEIETSIGYLPDHIQNRTGVVICRDGSIDNAEYVTVPMKGAKGIVNIKYLAQELAARTSTDLKCSLHFHLGTLPTDRLFIVALYALGIRIQDEIFKMFPGYKTHWQGIKKKDYNQKLRKLGTGLLKRDMNKEQFNQYVDEAYYRIFTFLNDGVAPDDRFNRNNLRHNRQHKWERAGRYYWLNFMNFFFSERKTAEFRLHHATLNGQKMVLWLYICNAIVRYAEIHSKEILSSSEPIQLNTVLDYYASTFKTKEGKFLSEYLKAYVQNRKDYFQKDLKKEDYISQAEIDGDKTFTFTHEGVTWFY